MADAQISSLKPFSIGYVTKNKAYDSRYIQALPVESASGTDSEVTHNPVESILKGTDADGNAFEVKATATRDLECEWMPFDDNRVTPPDVRRGELVMIYRLGNSTQYYWRCMNFKNALRTLEHVVHAYGAAPVAGGAGIDFNKCYTLAISPLNGYINLQTTQANGEPYAYTLQINTKEGFIGIQDDVGNYFELNSAESRLQLRNVNGSFVNVEKQWIDLKADKYIKFTVGGTTQTLTPDTIVTQTTTTTMNSSAQMNIVAPVVNAKCTRWEFT